VCVYVLMQHNLDTCFSNQQACVTHHNDPRDQPHQNNDLPSSRSQKSTLRSNDFLWVQTKDILHQKVLTQIFLYL